MMPPPTGLHTNPPGIFPSPNGFLPHGPPLPPGIRMPPMGPPTELFQKQIHVRPPHGPPLIWTVANAASNNSNGSAEYHQAKQQYNIFCWSETMSPRIARHGLLFCARFISGKRLHRVPRDAAEELFVIVLGYLSTGNQPHQEGPTPPGRLGYTTHCRRGQCPTLRRKCVGFFGDNTVSRSQLVYHCKKATTCSCSASKAPHLVPPVAVWTSTTDQVRFGT